MFNFNKKALIRYRRRTYDICNYVDVWDSYLFGLLNINKRTFLVRETFNLEGDVKKDVRIFKRDLAVVSNYLNERGVCGLLFKWDCAASRQFCHLLSIKKSDNELFFYPSPFSNRLTGGLLDGKSEAIKRY